MKDRLATEMFHRLRTDFDDEQVLPGAIGLFDEGNGRLVFDWVNLRPETCEPLGLVRGVPEVLDAFFEKTERATFGEIPVGSVFKRQGSWWMKEDYKWGANIHANRRWLRASNTLVRVYEASDGA